MAQYQYRHLARIVIETKTPLAVGSGEKDLITDQMIARDFNGLPFIPGTAIAGIIRHALGEEKAKTFFGFGGEKGQGSEIIFSSAQIVDEDGKVIEGLLETKSDYLKNFDELPIRQHVRINEKGTAEKQGKFDEEIVYKGTRFCFEIELLSKDNEDIDFTNILDELAKDTLRLGGGTRKGFGEIEIIQIQSVTINLRNPDDLSKYIEKSASLNASFWDEIENKPCKPFKGDDWSTYELQLKPDDFFLFGSGFGNDEADITPVFENYFDWSNGKPKLVKDAILIPGSSVKGALSHRVAFHYNKIKEYFAGNPNAKAGNDNPAVKALFGYTSQDEKEQKRGNVLISDVIVAKSDETTKIQNHISIDRFTGGAIEGALFSENVIYGMGISYILMIKVLNDVIADNDIEKSFESALFDIVEGKLALGGGINRGHGCFNGKLVKNGKEITK